MAAQERSAAPSPVLSTCNYSPVGSSLDKSMEFYQAVAGLEFGNVSTMGPAQKVFFDIHGIPVPNATFRWVIGRFGQIPCGIEPLEFGNVERTPVESPQQDPGVTTAVLFVRGESLSLGAGRSGGAPTQVALVRDMNGVFWEVVQRPPPASPARRQ